MESQYSEEEILQFTENALHGSAALAKVITSNATDIKACLEKKDASHLWDDFKNELIQSSVEGMRNSLRFELKKVEEEKE